MNNTTASISALQTREFNIGLELIAMYGLIPVFIFIQVLLRKYLGIRLYPIGRYNKPTKNIIDHESSNANRGNAETESDRFGEEISGEL